MVVCEYLFKYIETNIFQKWRAMSKEDKESYKSPRLPILNNKRKRDEATSIGNKLAKFAAN